MRAPAPTAAGDDDEVDRRDGRERRQQQAGQDGVGAQREQPGAQAGRQPGAGEHPAQGGGERAE